MSVLSAIKGKIVTVQQDLTSSLHLPFLSSKQESVDSTNTRTSATENQTFNANAGAELLVLYQHSWNELHTINEENASKAQELDTLVTNIFLKLDKENTAVNEFLAESMMLTKLVDQLGDVRELVSDLGERFKQLETSLATLEDVSDEMHQKKNVVEHEYQLTKYQQRKNMELEQAKVELARKHAGKVRDYEEHLNRTLKERQKVFEDAFREQMQNYKRGAKVNSEQILHASSSVPSNDQPVDLAEIAVDDDTSLLDSFLNSPELDNNEVAAGSVTSLNASRDNTSSSTDELKVTSDIVSDQQQIADVINNSVDVNTELNNEANMSTVTEH